MLPAILATNIVLFLFLVIFIIFQSLKNKNKNRIESEMVKMMMQQQETLTNSLAGIMKTVDDRLINTQKNIDERLHNTGKIMNGVREQLGGLYEATKNMQAIGKDISSLQDILRSPKLRGNLGEYLLEDLLKQIFPRKNFETQYMFKSGAQVDAIIRLGDGIVPVDSKFPMESFQRLTGAEDDEGQKQHKKEFISSVKQRINEIADKYILPGEGTFDFALMYIPAENIFYEIIVNDTMADKGFEIFNYAIEKHVIPVSPNSFYAYLMAITFGLRGLKIEEHAKNIVNELGNIQKSYEKFYNEYTLVGKHLKNATGKYEESIKKAEKFNSKVSQVTGIKSEIGETQEELPGVQES